VQQQRRQLDTRLPAPGKLLNRAIQQRPLELEPAGHFAAPPIGLVAITHQEFEHRFAGHEGVVLPQVAQPQLRMANHFAFVQLFVAQQNAAQGRLARAVAADKSHFVGVGDRHLGAVEQGLMPIALMSVDKLQEHCHENSFIPKNVAHWPAIGQKIVQPRTRVKPGWTPHPSACDQERKRRDAAPAARPRP
jgi:hypothetical protein